MDKQQKEIGFDYGLIGQLYEWIEAGKVDNGEVITILMLTRHRNSRSGTCNPSLSTLVKETGGQVSRSTFIRSIKSLSVKGIVKVVKSRTKEGCEKNNYEFPLVSNCHQAKCQIDTRPSVKLTKPRCQIDTLTREREQEKVNSVCITHTRTHEKPTLEDCLEVAEDMRKDGSAISDDFVRDTYVPRMSAKGWTNSKGSITRRNLRNNLEAWWSREKIRPVRSDVPQRDRHDQPDGVVLRQDGYDATRFDEPTLDAVDKATILQQLGGVA